MARVQNNLHRSDHFIRTDVLHFYATMDRSILSLQLAQLIPEAPILNLINGFINHLVDKDGVLIDNQKGIARGSSLSPLLGAIYLMPIAKAMDKLKVTCTIFMDDICLQVPTRWKLRKAVQRLNEVFNELNIEKHPDKTEIGRVEKGFNFLGYHYSLPELSVAAVTFERFNGKLIRLDEQGADDKTSELYCRRFTAWVFSGLRSLLTNTAWVDSFKKCLPESIWMRLTPRFVELLPLHDLSPAL